MSIMFDMAILKWANEFELEPELIKAVMAVESAYQADAIRYEPNFRWIDTTTVDKYAKKFNITYDTELILSKCSLGLMQTMGSVLRELGHEGHLLDVIRTPAISIKFGAKKLSELTDLYGDMKDVIASYNAGSPRKLSGGIYVNQEYVNKVLNEYDKLKRT